MVKPNVPENELKKMEKQIDAFDEGIKNLTENRQLPSQQQTEMQTKLSQKEINNSTDVYLKPHKIIGSRDKFNEKFRDKLNQSKEYVKFIAENKEIIGETIDIWTRPFGGMPAEMWKVPVNKPVWGPRYLAEQIKRKYYHRLRMENTPTSADNTAQYYGSMTVDTIVQRLDAHPVSNTTSVFTGARGF